MEDEIILWSEFKEMLQKDPFDVFHLIQNKNDELTALRAWKEQRLKEETRSYFKTLEENGQLGALIDELNKLRAWKASAMPLIQDELDFVNDILSESDPDDDPEFMQKEIDKHAILTELLGGSDEN